MASIRNTPRSDALVALNDLRWKRVEELDGYAKGYLDATLSVLGLLSAAHIREAVREIERYLGALDTVEETRRVDEEAREL